jgi:hypothetical protein
MDQDSYRDPYAAPPTSGLAVVSLIASIGGLTVLPTVGSVIGLILGYIAKRQIEESMGRMGGEGLARGGIIIGWVGIGLAVLLACFFLLLVLLGGAGILLTLPSR